MRGSFEWDAAKAAGNVTKHGITFEEAVTSYFDPNSCFADDGASDGHCIWIGFSAFANLLTVVHVERGERIRIISARRATADEERRYNGG